MKSLFPFNFVEQVRQFMLPPKLSVNRFDAEQYALYTGLQCEELAEKLSVIAAAELSSELRLQLSGAVLALDKVSAEFKAKKHVGAIMRADHVELLDGDIDLAFVSVGGAFSISTDAEGAMAEVCRANLAKYPNGQVIRHPETQKIMKPEGWKPPDLTPFVAPRED